jgi:hypothetical protein
MLTSAPRALHRQDVLQFSLERVDEGQGSDHVIVPSTFRPNLPGAERAARERFLARLLVHVDRACLGHVSEIADGELPHTPARPGLVGGRGAAAGVVQAA